MSPDSNPLISSSLCLLSRLNPFLPMYPILLGVCESIWKLGTPLYQAPSFSLREPEPGLQFHPDWVGSKPSNPFVSVLKVLRWVRIPSVTYAVLRRRTEVPVCPASALPIDPSFQCLLIQCVRTFFSSLRILLFACVIQGLTMYLTWLWHSTHVHTLKWTEITCNKSLMYCFKYSMCTHTHIHVIFPFKATVPTCLCLPYLSALYLGNQRCSSEVQVLFIYSSWQCVKGLLQGLAKALAILCQHLSFCPGCPCCPVELAFFCQAQAALCPLRVHAPQTLFLISPTKE